MATKVGDYEILVTGQTQAVRFWPLTPGTTVAQATPPAPIAPTNLNTVVAPPVRFGILDVVIRFTDEPIVTSSVVDPALLARITPAPAPFNTMPMTSQADGTAHICLALETPPGGEFNGFLRLHATSPGPQVVTVNLPIRVPVNSLVDDLFVFFVVHAHPPQNYGWAKIRVVAKASAAPIAGAAVETKILRDNTMAGFRKINRSISLQSGADGYIASGSRNVIGLRTEWPVIVNASAAGYVSRGHMLRLKPADIHHNRAPYEPATPVRMTPAGQASLATKRLMLDPGHGVVYAGSPTSAGGVTGRRSQEWYVASRIADEIEKILVTENTMLPGNILRTRTAGFGLIDPTHAQMIADTAPENGAKKYEYDMARKRVRIKQQAGQPGHTLNDLSELVLTKHAGTTNVAQPVSAADRQKLLALNGPTLMEITARINVDKAPAGRRVRRDSILWAAGRYQYTHEPITTPGAGGIDEPIVPITTNDWFTIDDAMLKILAERSARWSLANEIGSGHAASGSRKSFTDAARDALVAVGALIDGRGYMLDKILQEVNVKAPHAYLNHGNFGWGPNERVQFFNGNPCDLYLSIHEYDDGTGAECIVSRLAGADAPPDSQIRIAKIFAKYIDPFNQGLRTGGVTKEEPNNSVGMLHHGNTVRDKYAYFELEFMNAINPNDTDHYRYEEMVTVAFQERVARQIVDGIVEVLLDPQGDFDSVTLNGEFFPPPGTKLW